MRWASCAVAGAGNYTCAPNGFCPRPPPTPRPGGCDGLGSEVDACGTCGGPFVGGLRCEEGPAPLALVPADLPAACAGFYDACGTCNGTASAAECAAPCDGVPGSDRYWDRCGRCGGDGETCRGCDGADGVVDACGVCRGDNSTCVDCAGVAGGGRRLDRCNVCGGDGRSCEGCDGVFLSGRTYDAYRTCGGSERERRLLPDRCGVRGGRGDGCTPELFDGTATVALPPGGGPWSFASWIRALGPGVAFSSSWEDTELGCRPAEGSAWVRIDASGRLRLEGPAGAADGPALPSPFSAWHHLVLSRAADGSHAIYVNGTRAASIGGGPANITLPGRVVVGEGAPCGASGPAPGLRLSDVRLWLAEADDARAIAEMTLPPGAAGALAAAAAPLRGTVGSALDAPILASHAAPPVTAEDPADPAPGCAFPSNACGQCAPHADPDDPDASCPLDCDGVPLGPAIRGPCGSCECPTGTGPIPPPPWKATVLDPLRPLRTLALPAPEAGRVGAELWFADPDPASFSVELAGLRVAITPAGDGLEVAATGARLGPVPARGAWERLGRPAFELPSGESTPGAWALWPMNEGFGREVHDATDANRTVPAPYRRWVLASRNETANPVRFDVHRPSCNGTWRGAEARDACGTCLGTRATAAACPAEVPLAVARDARWMGPATPLDVVLPAESTAECASLLLSNRSERIDPTFFGASYDPLARTCTLHRLEEGVAPADRDLASLESEVGASFVARSAARLPPPLPTSPPAPSPPRHPTTAPPGSPACASPSRTSHRPRGPAARPRRALLAPRPRPRAPDARTDACAAEARRAGVPWSARQGRACWLLPEFDPASAGGWDYAGPDAVVVEPSLADLTNGTRPRLVVSGSGTLSAAVYEVSFGDCPAGQCPLGAIPYLCHADSGTCSLVRLGAPSPVSYQ
eukprot:tig00000385_g24766.t1